MNTHINEATSVQPRVYPSLCRFKRKTLAALVYFWVIWSREYDLLLRNDGLGIGS